MEEESFLKGLMTVVYDNDLTIKKIINPQESLLLKFDIDKLIGTNINELIKISKLNDKTSVQTIIKYVSNINSKHKDFFKYSVEINNNQKVDAVCMVEKRNDGNVYVNVIQTNQDNILNEKEIFRNYILDSTIYQSTVGLHISHIDKYGERRFLISNDTLREFYGNENVTMSSDWDENDEYKNDMLALKNHSCSLDKKIYDDNGNIRKWIMTTKKSVKCSDNGHFIISTTTDITPLNDKYSLVDELKLYSSLYNSIPMSVAVYDNEGILRSVNSQYLKLFYLDYHDIINKQNIKSDNNIPKWALEKLIKGEAVTYNNVYEIKKHQEGLTNEIDKQIRLLSVRMIPIRNRRENIIGYSQLFDDITENNIDKHLLDVIYKNLPLGIIIYDKEGNLLNLNDKDREIMGIDSSVKVDGINLFQEPNLSEEHIRKLKDGNDVVFDLDYDFSTLGDYFETSFKCVKRLHITISIIRNNGIIDGYLLMNQDITSDQKLLKEFQNSILKNKLILDNVGIGLAFIDVNYNILWKNSTYNELFDIDLVEEELINHPCYSSIFKKSSPCEKCMVKTIIETNKSQTVYNVKNSHDVFEITGVPVKGDDDKTIGVIIRIEKTTNEYNAKKESESLSRMLQTIIDNLPLGLYIKDVNDGFRYIIANKNICEFSEIRPEDCVGKTDYDIVSKDFANIFRSEDEDIVKKYKEAQVPIIKEKHIMWGGSEKFVKTINIVVKHDGKDILISTVLDETERETMLKELKIEKEHAEESDKLKSAFLANMSHEIRTPLNAIVGFSEIIATNDNKEENEEYIKIIQRNNQILLRLITDILDLSKIDAGAVKLKNKEFDLAELDSNFKAFYDNNKLDNNIEFITDLPYRKCIVNLDEQRFIQVCNNFITNAIKYTNKGYIKYGYLYENNGIKMYVKDTGCGIPKASQDKLFTRFGKLNDNIQGNGLGLTICKAILDMQKGKIGFESEEGEGATFWAWFPTNAVIERKLPETDTYNNIIKKDSRSCITIDNHKPTIKILIAEDNDSNYLLLKTLLKEYSVTRAVNGIEALEMAKNDKFNVILMDMKMPKMNGLEATKEIRKFDKNIMIIATTASAYDYDLKAEKEAGCNEILTKPITMKGRDFLLNLLKQIQ